MSKYPNFATREAAPPGALRGRDRDYSKLDDNDRRWVLNCLEHDYNKTITPNRVQAFLRRYHPEV